MWTSSREPNAPPTPARCNRTFSSGRARQGAICWRSAWSHWVDTYRSIPPSSAGTALSAPGPAGRHVAADPARLGGNGPSGPRAERRLVLHARFVVALDPDVGLGVRVA